MANLDSILKTRNISLPTKVCLVKAMVFPVVMYGCDSWTIKKAERWRIDTLELWYWRRLLRVPWTARRPNQSILKENSPDFSLEGLMFKLKLQYFGHLMWITDSFEKTLMLGKMKAGGEGNDREWDGWMASLTQWTWVCINSGSLQRTGRLGMLQSMGSQRVRHDWATELNWTGYFKIHVFTRCHILSINCLQFSLKFWKTNIISPNCKWEGQVSESQSTCRRSHADRAKVQSWAGWASHPAIFMHAAIPWGQNHMTTKPCRQSHHPQICQFIGQTFSRSFFLSQVWQWDVTHTRGCQVKHWMSS